MSASLYAYGVLGCRIDKSKLYKHERRRQCKHPLPDPGSDQYCPTCGKRAYDNEQVPIDGYDPEHETLLGLHVTTGTDGVPIVAGGHHVKADGYRNASGMLDATDVPAAWSHIRAVLEPAGLWDADEFGFWVILYCSY